MNTQVQARYSVLIAGGEFSIDDIRNLLQDGLKVIWFTDSDTKKKATTLLCDFEKAGFLEHYINNNNAHIIIEDGACSDNLHGILTALEKGDVRFNREQYEIEHQSLDKNMIIEAGAGTGKTHVMINRIMYLLHMDPEFDFSKVAMITFTNKATDNMRLRLIKTLDLKYKLTGNLKYVDKIEQLSQISISTIHSFFKKIIVEVGPTLGYGTNVQLKSYVQEKKDLLRNILDTRYRGRNRVEDVIGLPIHLLETLAMDYWEKLDNNGIAEEEIIKLDWGETEDEKSRLIQESLREIFLQVDERYNEIKYENNAISMKDIIHELSRVIDRPELKDYISNNYRYMFCDEFQDSDNVQIQTIAILNRIYDGNLFVVGDIKQSIYRFRGATDSAFLKLMNLLNEAETDRLVIRSLTKNYRTSAVVLSELDSIFEAWGPRGLGLLKYDDSDKLYPQEKESGEYRQIVISDGERQKKVIELIKRIQKLAEHRKITCLARKNSQLRKIKEWCEKEKIVCLIKERGSFYESRAVLDFCALIEAYLYDNEPVYLYNYILSSYGSGHVDYKELLECQGDKFKIFGILLREINITNWEKKRADIKNKPIMAVIRGIVEESNPVVQFGIRRKFELLKHGYTLEKATEQAQLDAKQYNANLKKLLQLLSDQFSGDFSSLTDLCDFLRLKIMTDKEEEPAEIESMNDIEYVEGLTVHGAKGLEFENVLLPYMNDAFHQSFRSEILVSRDHKTVGWVYRNNNHEDIKNKQYDFLLDEEEEEVAKEETRLLYVAMTRTIYGLYCFPVRKGYQNRQPSCWADLLPKEKDDARNF